MFPDILKKLKVCELLAIDIENKDSEVYKLIENITQSFILKNLSKEKRLKLYALLVEKKNNEAEKLVINEIPDFYLSLNKELSVQLANMLSENND